jgi:hypothetical protein
LEPILCASILEEAVEAHRIETTLIEDGTLVLEHLPFQAGARVEVIILAQAADEAGRGPYTLRGLPVHYAEPTEPVAEEDWDATT